MKRFALSLIFKLLKLTNGIPFSYWYSGKVQVLMFHRIVSSFGEKRINNNGIEVTEDYLEYLIQFYLKQSFIPISIGQLKRVIHQKDRKRYVVFSFDDGYSDNYEKALPIFEKYNIPFVVYVTTDFIYRKQFAWWYFIEDIIRENSKISFSNGIAEQTVIIETTKQKEQFFIELRNYIQNDNEILLDLINRYKPDMSSYHNLFLTVNQLKEFSRHPLVTIGSHTISHPSLSKISDEQSLHEIVDSKTELEKIIDKKVSHFSYPFGTINDISERDLKNVQKAGYETSLTTSFGSVKSNSHFHKLPRIWTSNHYLETELLRNIYGINEFNVRKQ